MDSGGIHHCSGLEQGTDRDRSVDAGTKFTNIDLADRLSKFLQVVRIDVCEIVWVGPSYIASDIQWQICL